MHHKDDLHNMCYAVLALLDDHFGDADLTTERLDWLDTDEGKNAPHLLDLWDANEDAGYFDDLYARNPETMQRYLGDEEPTEESKARAAYDYGFDLFDDVVAKLRRRASGA